MAKDGLVSKFTSRHIYGTIEKGVIAILAKDLGVPVEHLAHSEQARTIEYCLNQRNSFFETKSKINENDKTKVIAYQKTY